MDTAVDARTKAVLSSTYRILSAAAALVGILVLLGWALNNPALISGFPGLEGMKANVALAFVLCSLSLWLRRGGDSRGRSASMALAMLVALLGLVTLMEYLFGLDVGIDQVLINDFTVAGTAYPPGRMAPLAAFNFVILCLSLLLLDFRSRTAQLLALMGGLIGLLEVISFSFYETRVAYGFLTYTQMPLITSLCFISLSAGILSSQSDRGFMAAFASNGPGGLTMRRIFFPLSGFLMLLGWLGLAGERAGLYESTFGHAYVVVAFMAVLLGVLWWNSASLDRVEANRRAAQSRIIHLNGVLSALRSVNQLIVREHDTQVMMEQSCEILLQARDYRMVWIGLVREDTKKITPFARAGVGADRIADLHITCDENENCQCPSCTAMRTLRPAVCCDMMPDQSPGKDAGLAGGSKSSIAVPMIFREHVLGVLNVYSNQPQAFDDEEISLLKELAGDLAYALQSMAEETRRKQAEEALQAKESRYRSLLENAPLGIISIDSSGRITEFNSKILELIGSPSPEFTRSINLLTFPPMVQANISDDIRQCLEAGQVVVNERHYVSHWQKDTILRYHIAPILDADQNIVGAQGIIEDITERKRAENLLTQEKALLRCVIDSIPDLIFFKGPNSVYLGCNKAFEEYAGRPESEQIGKTDFDFFDIKTAEFFRENDWLMLEVGESRRNEEWVTYPDGRRALLDTLKTPFYGPNGEKLGLVGISRDITERRRAEEALRDSESKLAAIIEFLPDATLVIDLDGKVVAWNRAIEEMTGVSRDSMIGQGDLAYTVPFYGDRRRHLLDLIDLDDKNLASKYQYVQKKGNTLYAETYTPALNGGKGAYVWAIGAPIFDNKGNRIGAIESIRDITERKRAERTLQEQLNLLQQLIDAIPSPIFYKDTRGVTQGCNKAFETLIGLSKDKIVGQNVYGLYPKDLADIYYETDNKLFQNPGVQVYETAIAHADGSRRDVMFSKATYFDTEGHLAGLVGVILDITVRKHMENALRESQRRLADIINFLPDSTFVIDKEGKVIAWNHAIAALTGIKAEEMLGKGNYEHSLPFYGQRRPILIDLVLRPQEEVEQEYSNLKREDGALVGEAYMPMLGGGNVYLWGVASALYDSQGNIVGAIESIKDITERNRSEEILKASLQEKEVLLKEIHHRVKNNLQIVSSLLSLESRKIQDKETADAFRDSQNRIKSMALVHEKLYRSEDLSKVYLNEYINKLTRDLILSFESGKKVKFYPDLEEVFLGIDKAIPFGLILNELITNSLEHAFPAGKPGEIYVGLNSDGHRLTLTVRDNGVGIPADLDINNPRSMGLTLVQSLVKQLKGTLEVNSNGGTEFKVRIDI
ncbi:MAG TPA: PAS domain S-box protein [Methanotrichaceae archaeon]|nr:PAS domain S-box protein [Methanotrichaceae archaeon]